MGFARVQSCQNRSNTLQESLFVHKREVLLLIPPRLCERWVAITSALHPLYRAKQRLPMEFNPPGALGGEERIAPPRCPSCGARIRPGVVWFGEALPDGAWASARESARQCDVFFCIGTSSLVQPAASLTDTAISAGATTIQINPKPTDIDDSVTFALRGLAGTILPQLVAETWNIPQ